VIHQVAPNKLTFLYFEKVVLLTLFLASRIHQVKTVIPTVYWISRALWPMAPSLLLGRPASHSLAGRPVDEWTFNSTPFHLFQEHKLSVTCSQLIANVIETVKLGHDTPGHCNTAESTSPKVPGKIRFVALFVKPLFK